MNDGRHHDDAPGDRLLSQGAEVLVREILAAPPDALHCDVLIIGSGYGGAVAAARLAGALSVDATPGIAPGAVPIKVYLLERGSEYLPGEFPATFAELPGQVRFSMQDGRPARGSGTIAARRRRCASGRGMPWRPRRRCRRRAGKAGSACR